MAELEHQKMLKTLLIFSKYCQNNVDLKVSDITLYMVYDRNLQY